MNFLLQVYILFPREYYSDLSINSLNIQRFSLFHENSYLWYAHLPSYPNDVLFLMFTADLISLQTVIYSVRLYSYVYTYIIYKPIHTHKHTLIPYVLQSIEGQGLSIYSWRHLTFPQLEVKDRSTSLEVTFNQHVEWSNHCWVCTPGLPL